MRFSIPFAFITSVLLVTACNEPEVVINNAPLADGGDAVTQPADQKVLLDGRASYDKDGDALTYYWTFDHLPADSTLNDKISPFTVNQTEDGSTTFQPDTIGTYIVKLEVFDGKLYSDASYVVVNATEPENAPEASAGADIQLEVGSVATLNGSQSSDPLGGVLTFQWSLVEVPTNSALTQSALIDADQMEATFSADVLGWYTATLVVHNGLSYSSPDSVRIHFNGENAMPVADAGPDMDEMDCTEIQLDCSASVDPEGEALSYWWILQSKPENSAVDNRYISGQGLAAPTFWADVAGDYTMSCSVFDGNSWSHPATISLNVAERDYNTPPSVNAGGDQEIEAGDVECESTTSSWYPYNTTWTCDSCEDQTTTIGVATEDADDDPYVVEWIVDKDNKGATVVGLDRVPATVVLEPSQPTRGGSCKDRDFDFTLSATDCTGANTQDDVSITVECCGVGS